MSEIKKSYLSADEYLADIWRLSFEIVKGGWKPDLLLALWRGGAPVGVAVHEFLKTAGWDVRHIPVKCFSYDGIASNDGELQFDGGEEVFSSIAAGDRVLVIDDVFDSGKTAVAVKQRIEQKGAKMRFASVYWKVANNRSELKPDYYVNSRLADWIVFPHEIEGLSEEERLEKDPHLSRLVTRAMELLKG
jgi:hypoxanthine phosphoribosyltransferase